MKKAFTLLEVVIVIIIVGVLASLALPRLFAMVEYARSAEALVAIGTIRGAFERHYLLSGSYTGAALNSYPDLTMNTLDIDDPANSPNAHFLYIADGTGDNYSIVACRNSRDGGNGGSIALTYNLIATGGAPGPCVWQCGAIDDGELHWCGTGPFENAVP